MRKIILMVLLPVFLFGFLFAQYPEGNALDFDGVDDYVEISDSPSIDIISDITISAWIYGNNFEVNDLFIHKINAYGISIRGSGEFSLTLSQDPNGINWGEFSSNFLPSTGEWIYLAATYDASAQKVKLYANGDLKNTLSYSNPIASSAGDLYFGGYGGGQNHQGMIDEVRIWNVTRTQTQIQTLMNDTLGTEYYATTDSGLIGYWRFDEGIAGSNNTNIITLPDLCSDGNHGTLNNFALDGYTSNWVSSDAPLTAIQFDHFNFPATPQLKQNYPNPFNSTTRINYQITQANMVTLKIYDLLGRELSKILVNEYQSADTYHIKYDAGKLSSGIYFYKLQAGDFVETKKMFLMR